MFKFFSRFSRKPKQLLCSCGIAPTHGPSVAECSAVAKAAGYTVTEEGYILDKKRRLFFDGSVWLHDGPVNYKRY